MLFVHFLSVHSSVIKTMTFVTYNIVTKVCGRGEGEEETITM